MGNLDDTTDPKNYGAVHSVLCEWEGRRGRHTQNLEYADSHGDI